MTTLRDRRPARGMTLLEILVVVSIIALLLSLMGVVAANAIKGAKIRRTQTLIERVKAGLTAFYGNHQSQYPPETSDTWPAAYVPMGVEFERAFLAEQEGEAKLKVEDYDSADTRFLLDAWGRRIRYRKTGPGRMLVWSAGPDGIDQIGSDAAGRKENAGDDITGAGSGF